MPYVATNNTGGTIAIRDHTGKHLVENGASLSGISKSVANQCRSRGFDVDFVEDAAMADYVAPATAEPVEDKADMPDDKPKRKASVKVSED